MRRPASRTALATAGGRRARGVHPRDQGVLRARLRRRPAGADPAARDRAARRRRARRDHGRLAGGPARPAAAATPVRSRPRRRRRHRQRRDRRRPRGRAPRADGSTMGRHVTLLATDAPRRRSTSPARTPSGTPSADGMRFVEADLLPPVLPDGGAPFDIVLANLPYVRSDAIAGLPIAASFEPRAALDGGPDGLDVIRALLERLPEALADDGVALARDRRRPGRGRAGGRRGASCPAGGARSSRTSPGCRGSCGSSAGVVRGSQPRPTPALPIRLVALDLDGTLIGDDLELRDRTMAAIRAARRARRLRLDRHRPDDDERDRLRPAARPHRADRRLPGRDHPRLPARGRRAPRASCCSIGRCRPTPPAKRRPGLAVDRAVAPRQPPRAVHHPGRRPAGRRLLGVPRVAGGRSSRRPDRLAPPPGLEGHLSRRSSPVDEAGLADVRRRFAGRAEVTVSHPALPRVPGPRRLEGRRRRMAGTAGPRPDGERARDRRPVQRPRDDRRASAMGRRCRSAPRARPRRRTVRRPAPRRGGRGPADRAARAGRAGERGAQLGGAGGRARRAVPDGRADGGARTPGATAA